MLFSRSAASGFTLVEIMIVLTVILLIGGIGLFPYGYYLERGYTDRASDGLAQEWIMAHRAIRGGLEFDSLVGSHARLLFVFEKGRSEIDTYLLSGSQIPDINLLPTDPNSIKKYKTIVLENGIQVLGFSGSLSPMENKIGYIITPPNGEGSFFTGSTLYTLTGSQIILGYPGATLTSGRSREILLRTYLR